MKAAFTDEVWDHAPYRLIYADPPWPCPTRKRTGHAPVRGDGTGRKRSWMFYASDPYRTMTRAEILAVPVPQIADQDGSILILWTPWAHLALAVETLAAWGFSFSTGCPWLKTAKNGDPHYGVGMWFQHCTEVLLIGRCGKLSWDGFSHPSPARKGLFVSRRGQHSEKPAIVAEWAESLKLNPKIELWARRRRKGWSCWGDQLQ